jgi:hypothetical protein
MLTRRKTPEESRSVTFPTEICSADDILRIVCLWFSGIRRSLAVKSSSSYFFVFTEFLFCQLETSPNMFDSVAVSTLRFQIAWIVLRWTLYYAAADATATWRSLEFVLFTRRKTKIELRSCRDKCFRFSDMLGFGRWMLYFVKKNQNETSVKSKVIF